MAITPKQEQALAYSEYQRILHQFKHTILSPYHPVYALFIVSFEKNTESIHNV